MGVSTPWGTSDGSRKIATGIVEYYTPRHGGIHLSPKRMAQMPAGYIKGYDNERGWFEEDCEAQKIILVFPEFFDAKWQETALASVKNYFPEQYTEVTGIEVLPAESYALRRSLGMKY